MATIIQLRRDNTVNWADADPILAEGEMGWEKSGNEITAYKIGDGVRKWSELPYGSNISILQELGDNETAVISQKAVTDEINKDRYMIYPSTGIMGSPIPDLNHVANYSSGGDFIAYNESTEYDCAWVNIYEGSKNLTITGATPSIIGYFSALLPTPESLLGKGTTIPTGAKICLVNFLKSANTGGYGNLKITQEGMPGTKEDSEAAKRDIKAVVSLSNCLADSFTATPVSINLLDTVNLLRNWGFQDGAVVNDPKFITSGKIYLKSMYYTVQGIRAYSTNLNLYIASFDFDGNYIGRTLIPLESASNLTKTFLYTKLSGAAYERIVLSSTGDLPSYANMQLEEGFTAHTPVAFQGWVFDESERDFVSQSRMRYSEYPVGKNYINESDLLYGYSLQNGAWIPLVRGVASNRLFLKDGTTYTVSNLAVFSPTITNMYLAYFDKDGNFLKRTAHAMVVDSTGLKGSCTFTANVDDGQTFYVRMVLQSSNVNVNYVPNPQLEVGSAATAYEAYAGTKYVLEVKGSKSSEEKNVLLTGASFAFPDNEWFRYVCDDLGITGYNKAVSGETMQHTAQKMHDGTLYTQAEFEDFDIFLIFHSHNQTVTDTTNLKENYEDYVFPLTDRSAQWDYVLKKYAAECYAARLNTNSRWYGTKDGKPYRVVVVTHWHDARTIFNNSIRELQAKWGFTLCELDKRIGFSKNEVHPVTGAQVSILHCDNPSNNTEIIDGVEYGWHPTRNKGAWIQHRMADIIGDTLVTCEAPTGDALVSKIYSCVNIVGFGLNASDAGVTKTGDVYYKTDTNQLRKCLNYFSAMYETLQTDDSTLVYYDGKYYTLPDLVASSASALFNRKRLLLTRNEENGLLNNLLIGTIYEGMAVNGINGTYVASSNFSCAYFNVSPGMMIGALLPYQGGLLGLAWFTEDNVFISGENYPVDSDYINKGLFYKEIVAPDNAFILKATIFNEANRLSEGHYSNFAIISYLNKDSVKLNQDEICRFYRVNSVTGVVDETDVMGCTRYIDCKGVSSFKVMMPSTPTSTAEAGWGLAFYNASKTFISGVNKLVGTNGASLITVTVPNGAAYFRTTYWNYTQIQTNNYPEFECYIDYPKGVLGYGKYRPYISGEIYFSRKVNQGVNNYWDNTVEIQQPTSYKDTTGVLLLPSNYSPEGNPVPIIMYCHGYSHYVYYDHWGATDSFRLQKQHWADAGFAVFDCNGARNNTKVANFTGAGSSQFVDGYRQCLDYIKENYNVEDRVCIVGGSAGGPTAINAAYYWSDVKAVALLSAWTNLLTCSWDQGVRDTFVEYLGFANTTTYEKDKTVGYDPALRIVTIAENEYEYFPVPVKAWIGSTESTHVLYTALYRFINAARNQGCTAFIRELEGLTHTDVVSGANVTVDTEVATWFKTY